MSALLEVKKKGVLGRFPPLVSRFFVNCGVFSRYREFPVREPVLRRCVLRARKITGIMTEQYNDSNEVLINSLKRKLIAAVVAAASALFAFNGRTSREQSRKFQRGSGDGDRFRIVVGKADLSSGVAEPGLASNYSAVPSRCRRSFGRTEIRQVNQRSLRSPRARASSLLSFPFRWRVSSASFARILEYFPGETPAILLGTYRKFICKFLVSKHNETRDRVVKRDKALAKFFNRPAFSTLTRQTSFPQLSNKISFGIS